MAIANYVLPFIFGMLFACTFSYFFNDDWRLHLRDKTLYDLAKDLGPVAVAVVAAFIAALAYFQPWEIDKIKKNDELIGARNLACYATRFVIPYISEAQERSSKEFEYGRDNVFKVVLDALNKVEIGKLYPPELTNQLVDIMYNTQLVYDWQKSHTKIGGTSLEEKTVADTREKLQYDIGCINKYIRENIPNATPRLAPCRSFRDRHKELNCNAE